VAGAEVDRPVYRTRFGLAYLFLAVVLGAGVGGFIVFVSRPSPPPEPEWARWSPTASEAALRIRQIAGHVSARYHLANGRRLVGVTFGPPGGAISVAAIAVRAPGARSASDISFVRPQDSLMLNLCGLGKDCSITPGPSTRIRGRLVRREALELALYTFKYVDAVDSVVAFMPPASGSKPSHALLFLRSDFLDELSNPLLATLPRLIPPTPAESDGRELKTIDRLTLPRYFRYQFQQTQDGSTLLVLDPTLVGE
jgi:hypothetical protein